MSETRNKRTISSLFRLPRIPIKGLNQLDTSGFKSFNLNKQEGGSIEVKDSFGVQQFWVELGTAQGKGNAAEIVGIFGESIAVLRRDSPMSPSYTLTFTDANDFIVTFTMDNNKSMLKMKLIKEEGGSEVSEYQWLKESKQWHLKNLSGNSIYGTYEANQSESCKLQLSEKLLPEDVTVFTFGIAFLAN